MAAREGPDGRHVGQRQLVQRPGQRTWESRRRGNRLEVGEALTTARLERRSRRDRLRPHHRKRRHAARRENRRRKPSRELRETEAVQTDGARPRERDGAGQVVCRPARRRNDECPLPGTCVQPCSRLSQPAGGLGGFDDSEGGMIQSHASLPAAMPGHRLHPRHADEI